MHISPSETDLIQEVQNWVSAAASPAPKFSMYSFLASIQFLGKAEHEFSVFEHFTELIDTDW